MQSSTLLFGMARRSVLLPSDNSASNLLYRLPESYKETSRSIHCIFQAVDEHFFESILHSIKASYCIQYLHICSVEEFELVLADQFPKFVCFPCRRWPAVARFCHSTRCCCTSFTICESVGSGKCQYSLSV